MLMIRILGKVPDVCYVFSSFDYHQSTASLTGLNWVIELIGIQHMLVKWINHRTIADFISLFMLSLNIMPKNINTETNASY